MSERHKDDSLEAQSLAFGGSSSSGVVPTPSAAAAARRPYAVPRLERHGRLVDLTMGGSPGPGDSGSNINFHQPI